MTATIVKKEDIFKFLESLRKRELKGYVQQWASNDGHDFIITEKFQSEFSFIIGSIGSHTDRALKDDFEFISNRKFKKRLE